MFLCTLDTFANDSYNHNSLMSRLYKDRSLSGGFITMKRTALCFLLAVFALLFSTASFAEELVPLDAKLEIISGQVKLTRVGSNKTDVINESCDLYAGDLLETLIDSKATLAYADGTNMRIKERTLIEVQPMSIRVFKGKTWYKFTKRGTEFRIETPSLVAGIRGTEFEVAVTSRKKTSVSVVEGAVAVRGNNAGDALLTEGLAAFADAEGDLSKPVEFNTELKKAEWSDKDWEANNSGTDVYKLYMDYINLKNEYGEDDPRAVEAMERFKKAEKKENKASETPKKAVRKSARKH